LIAIDLGSNSFRVLVYDCESGRSLGSFEKVVKTADNLSQTKKISDAAIKRVIDAILLAKSQFDFTAHTIRAVTTEAIRQATNAQEVIGEIKNKTGIEFETISGEEEAGLTLKAVKKRLKLLTIPSDSFFLIDIGGGSTEFIFSASGATISKSFPIGIVTIAQKYESVEKISTGLKSDMHEMKYFFRETMHQLKGSETFVATAGTPTSIAAMKCGLDYAYYDSSKINGTTLNAEELGFYLNRLLKMSQSEREQSVGTGREELIVAGILIFAEIFSMTKFEKCIIVDDGLREGVALEMCNK